MAHEVVRQVRQQLAIERLQEAAAKLAETLDGITPARGEEAFRVDGA